MSYDIGTHIDLTYINKRSMAAPSRQKKSLSETTQHLYDIGTSLIFQITPTGIKTAIKIPVALA